MTLCPHGSHLRKCVRCGIEADAATTGVPWRCHWELVVLQKDQQQRGAFKTTNGRFVRVYRN